MINLVIVSDIRLYREGLSMILNEAASIGLVGNADNATQAIEVIRSCKPDIILLDMGMIDHYKVLSAIENESYKTKLIVLSVPEDETNVLTCAEAGISGYLTRDSSLDGLLDAVLKVHNGEIYCPADITKHLLRGVKRHKDSLEKHGHKQNNIAIFDMLTRREREVMNMMAEGCSNKQIARNLTIEVSTVKNHVHNVLVKLNAKSRAQAVSKFQHTLPI